jgi:hypothetical protein
LSYTDQLHFVAATIRRSLKGLNESDAGLIT